MKAFLKELKFDSTKHTYIQDITEEINKAIKQAKVENGFVVVNTTHTLQHVHEDKRSYRASKDWQHPTKDYLHRCQDNPFCDEIDEDYNAASHIRSLTFS